MSCPLFWPTIVFFYPIGNTSAVCLTENLPPESNADVLLLACGDPGHILYTVHVNETNPLTCMRRFDVTCCDVDVAILARNALLFSILADDGALNKLDNLWNLIYHMFVDQASLAVLFEQCRKLIALAESVETWRAGPYGHFLTTCDTRTLAGLRRMWTTYLTVATFSPEQTEQFEQRFIAGMKEMSRKKRSGSITTAGRSAGPLVSHASQAVSCQFSSYWTSGTTNDAQGQDRGQYMNVNPTFTFSNYGDKFAVHYATDPLCGFHLAEAFASGKFTRLHESIPPHEVVRVAKEQFTRWCTSINKRLKSNNPSSPTFVIRMFAGDALTFCQALKFCEVTRSPVTPYNVAAWRLSTIMLDDHCYGRNAVSPAPLSFNVIDTSNIMDHVGLINVLVVTAPLLRKEPTATLYTESLHRKSKNSSQAILEHICGDLPTMSLLLGVIPSTFIPQFTTRFNTYENLTTSGDASQYHERLTWKVIGFGAFGAHHGSDIPTPVQCLSFPPKDLANFLFRVYIQMFSDEDVESGFLPKPFLPLLSQVLFHSGVVHYNRRSFALFVHFVKTRIQTDWWHTMSLFENLVMTDHRLISGRHTYQELCCQFHLLGVYTAQWMSVPALRLHYREFDADVGLFHDWNQSCIPQVVTLVLVVPHEALTVLDAHFMDIGTPVLLCSMQDLPRECRFAVTSATFGSLQVSGAGEHRTGVVIEGDTDTGGDGGLPSMQPPWRTGASMIIAFSLPSGLVMDFGRNPRTTIGLTLRATPQATFRLTDQLAPDMTLFRTDLTNKKRVFILAQTPVMGTSSHTNAGTRGASVGAGADIPDHWQESMRAALHPEQATSSTERTSADVHVQMNNKSSAVRSFTVRINVTDPDTQAALADAKIISTIESASRSTRSISAYLMIGTHTFSLRFPLPVDVAYTRLCVARKSLYVEVVAPLTAFNSQPESDLLNRFAPLSSVPEEDYTPMLGSIHRLNLDQCPTFKLFKGPAEVGWCDMHIRLMFSKLEKQREFRGPTKPRGIGGNTSTTPILDVISDVKQTLHVLLCSAADLMREGGHPWSIFALYDTSSNWMGSPYLYIIVAQMRLDVGSHTVVADAFVAPSTSIVEAALNMVLRHGRRSQKLDDNNIQCISTDADESAAWFHLLPRLTERCRTWPHKRSCTYHTVKCQKQEPREHSLAMWGRRGPLCTCGAGVGTEILPKAFEPLAPYLTRAALSPLFSVPYLDEVDVPMGPIMGTEMGRPWMAAATSGTPLHNQNTNLDKRDAVKVQNRCRSCGKEGGQICSRCKQARYCSKLCQRADWKEHKKDCGIATGSACRSDLANLDRKTSEVVPMHADQHGDEKKYASGSGVVCTSNMADFGAPTSTVASTRVSMEQTEDGEVDRGTSIETLGSSDLADGESTTKTSFSIPEQPSSSSASHTDISTIVNNMLISVPLTAAGIFATLHLFRYIRRR